MLFNHRNFSCGTRSKRLLHRTITRSKLSPTCVLRCSHSFVSRSRAADRAPAAVGMKLASSRHSPPQPGCPPFAVVYLGPSLTLDHSNRAFVAIRLSRLDCGLVDRYQHHGPVLARPWSSRIRRSRTGHIGRARRSGDLPFSTGLPLSYAVFCCNGR